MTDEQSPQAPGYLAQFGLQRDPFAVAPDPEFFCADSALTQRLDMLQNLTEFGMLTLLVSGAPGMGKTSILQQYLRRAGSNWQVCHLEADQLNNAHDLIEDLANGFHVPGVDLARLRAQLEQLQAQGQLAVLVVDDAERLSDAALRILLELSGAVGETDRRLRLVLFGAEHLQDKLAALSPGHADNTHVFNIPPLGDLQTAAYLRHRFKVAGLDEDAIFSPGQIKSIVNASHGVPARINARARQLLIDRHSISGGPSATAMASPTRRGALIAAAGAGALLIVVALWPKSAKHGAETPRATAESAAPVAEKTVQLTLPNVAPAVNSTVAGASVVSGTPVPATVATPLPVPTLGPEVEHPVPTSPSGKIAVSSMPAPETAAPPAPLVATHPATPSSAAPLPVPPTVTYPVPKSPLKAPPLTPPARSAKAALSTAGAATVKGVSSSRGNAWLLTQRPGDYTLQIMGGRNAAAIHRFAAANRLAGPSAILQTVRDGKAWYVLFYGAYPSRSAANQALASLTAKVRAAKPWPRQIATVQAEHVKKH